MKVEVLGNKSNVKKFEDTLKDLVTSDKLKNKKVVVILPSYYRNFNQEKHSTVTQHLASHDTIVFSFGTEDYHLDMIRGRLDYDFIAPVQEYPAEILKLQKDYIVASDTNDCLYGSTGITIKGQPFRYKMTSAMEIPCYGNTKAIFLKKRRLLGYEDSNCYVSSREMVIPYFTRYPKGTVDVGNAYNFKDHNSIKNLKVEEYVPVSIFFKHLLDEKKQTINFSTFAFTNDVKIETINAIINSNFLN